MRSTKLTRKIHEMPEYIQTALEDAGLIEDYQARPPYQRNDYIGWILRAKTNTTRSKRLEQMLSELKQGGVYMKMKHPPSQKQVND